MIPGDMSSAAFFLVAASIAPGSEFVIEGVGVNTTRTGILEILKAMGADIPLENEREVGGEPIADLRVKHSDLKGVTIEGDLDPRLIDELPVLAIAATQAEGRTIVRDAQELRVKETDRIGSIVDGLSHLGAKIKELSDGFVIDGPTPLSGGRCRSYGDHRTAMALAVAGLVASEPVEISGSHD